MLITLIGPEGSGKTTIVEALCKKDIRSVEPTISANFYKNKETAFWDLSGRSEYCKLCTLYCYNADIVYLVCDLSKIAGNISHEKYRDKIDAYRDDLKYLATSSALKNPDIWLIGSKYDLVPACFRKSVNDILIDIGKKLQIPEKACKCVTINNIEELDNVYRMTLSTRQIKIPPYANTKNILFHYNNSEDKVVDVSDEEMTKSFFGQMSVSRHRP